MSCCPSKVLGTPKQEKTMFFPCKCKAFPRLMSISSIPYVYQTILIRQTSDRERTEKKRRKGDEIAVKWRKSPLFVSIA